MLSKLDQDEHISTIPRLDRDHPMFYWIFKNMDFTQWSSAKCSRVLWLSGPLECNIPQVSSYIVSQEKNAALNTEHFVLYFFCSAATKTRSVAANFTHTLLNQIVCSSPMDKRILIIRRFLYSLIEGISNKEASLSREERVLKEKGFPDISIQSIILNAPPNELFTALEAVLGDEEQRGLSVIIDGLDKVSYQQSEFIREVRAFVECLQQRISKIKILLTSRPLAEIKDLFGGLPCIEHDRERKGPSVP